MLALPKGAITMKWMLVLIPLVVTGVAVAQGDAAQPQKFGGYLYDEDTAAFVVNMQQETEHWYFTVPGEVFFWVKVYNSSDVELDDIDLSDGPVITLAGSAGDKFKLKIYAVAGDGGWAAERRDQVDDEGTTVTYTDEEPGVADVETYLDRGNLDEGDTYDFSYQSDQDTAYLVFTAPSDAGFTVTVTRKSGKVLGTYSLEEGNTIPLIGGGKFNVEIEAKDGSGDWTVKPLEE
jgi:hypothetical protein